MLNKVMLMGRLGRDPEMKYLQSGAAITTFNVATDESWIDRNGQKIEHTEWHRIITFQRLAENCAQHIVKGSLVYVEGSLQTRKWQDASGQNRYVTEIKAQRVLFLDRKRPDNQDGYGDSEEWRNRQGTANAPYEQPRYTYGGGMNAGQSTTYTPMSQQPQQAPVQQHATIIQPAPQQTPEQQHATIIQPAPQVAASQQAAGQPVSQQATIISTPASAGQAAAQQQAPAAPAAPVQGSEVGTGEIEEAPF